MRLALVGVSHRQAPVELRERVAVDADGAATLAGELALGCEAVVLSTCNRTELYLASEDDERPPRRARERVAARTRRRRTAQLSRRCCTGSATTALRCTSSGSPPASTRSCRAKARSSGRCGTPSRVGATGTAPRPALPSGAPRGPARQVETAIGESPASVPAAAAALAQQVFGDLASRSVLLVGAGKMSELTARNLLTRGARDRRGRQPHDRPRSGARRARRVAGRRARRDPGPAGDGGRRRHLDERPRLRRRADNGRRGPPEPPRQTASLRRSRGAT